MLLIKKAAKVTLLMLLGYSGIASAVYALNNPLKYIDPTGLDVWIEGPSAGEPAGHTSVNVGKPNGNYSSYSFGVNGNGFEGEVYRDQNKGGDISSCCYQETTSEQDQIIQAYLESLVGTTLPYRPWRTCRNFSGNIFDKIKQQYGKPGKPNRPNNPNNPSPDVGFPMSSVPTDPAHPVK